MLPLGSRLALSVKAAGTTLEIDEVRASSIAVRFGGWERFEPGICLVHATLRVAPHVCLLESQVICSVGLHALARRYQRSADISRSAIYDDVAALAAAPVDGDGNEIEVRTKHGRWLCLLVHLTERQRVAIARTFL